MLVVSCLDVCLLIKLVLRRGSGVANDGSSFDKREGTVIKGRSRSGTSETLIFIRVKGCAEYE